MNRLNEDTHFDAVIYDLKANNVKDAMNSIIQKAAAFLGCEPREIKSCMTRQDVMGDAGIGGGVALPNMKMTKAKQSFTLIAHLDTPVTLGNTPDNEPVDVICFLISPRADGPIHLRRLARLSRLFVNDEMVNKIRSAQSEESLRMVVNKTDGWLVAA